MGGAYASPIHELTRKEIASLQGDYARAARRAADVGYKWLELHFAHGYLGSSFLSPLANRRLDEYGGTLENRVRFCLEVIDAVRAVWPERLPLTVRLGCDDLHPAGIQFEDSITTARWMKERGVDLVDPSLGGNTDDMTDPPFANAGFMLGRAARIKDEVEIPVASSWNLGVPNNADAAVRSGQIDLVMLGRPALANPHWPVWAARVLACAEPFSLLPLDWSWYLTSYRGHAPSVGWPVPEAPATQEAADPLSSTNVSD